MKNPIVALVEQELTRFKEARQRTPRLYLQQDNLYPVPFFGDIRNLEVLTVGLNPASGEFADGRFWPPNQFLPEEAAPTLTTRLLNYFDLPEPDQHKWFNDLEKALLYIGCSYTRNAAHVDILSHPTTHPESWPAGFTQHLSLSFAAAVDRHEPFFDSVLNLIRQPRLIFVVNYGVRGMQGIRVWDKFRPKIVGAGQQTQFDGQSAPILIRENPQSLAEAVFQKRRELRDYLNHGPSLAFCTHG